MSDTDSALPEALQYAAMRNDSYDVIVPWSNSIGIQTQSLKYAHLKENSSSVALDFLVSSRCRRNDPDIEQSIANYLSDVGQVMLSHIGDDEQAENLIPLPSGPRLAMELEKTLINRRSVRSYTADPISLSYLASLLRSANGITAKATVSLQSGDEVSMHYRTAPSAGGLYPIDLYFAATKVKGLELGVYRYHPKFDAISQCLGKKSVDLLLKASAFPEEMINCQKSAAIFMLISRPWKTMRKYGDRGLKLIYQEAGSISQNLHLAATALGLGSVDCAGFYDHEVHQILNIDGVHETLIHVIVMGTPG